jgi:hypothetical protein
MMGIRLTQFGSDIVEKGVRRNGVRTQYAAISNGS